MKELLHELWQLYNSPLFQFITTEFVFVCTSLLGFIAMNEFIKTEDGQLRVIMIWFFATIGVTYLTAGINFGLIFFELPHLSPFVLRMVFGLPKLFIMVWLVWYLKHYNKKAA